MGTSGIYDFTDLLSSIFEDKPIELVLTGVKSYILSDDSGFPPDIGKINKKSSGYATMTTCQ
jgi:hypothetical protein